MAKNKRVFCHPDLFRFPETEGVLDPLAAGSKAAAGRKVDRVWDIAVELDPGSSSLRIRHRNGGEKKLAVGMDGMFDGLLRRPNLDDLAEVHDGSAIADAPDE